MKRKFMEMNGHLFQIYRGPEDSISWTCSNDKMGEWLRPYVEKHIDELLQELE